jgi:hypothetical protein
VEKVGDYQKFKRAASVVLSVLENAGNILKNYSNIQENITFTISGKIVGR